MQPNLNAPAPMPTLSEVIKTVGAANIRASNFTQEDHDIRFTVTPSLGTTLSALMRLQAAFGDKPPVDIMISAGRRPDGMPVLHYVLSWWR